MSFQSKIVLTDDTTTKLEAQPNTLATHSSSLYIAELGITATVTDSLYIRATVGTMYINIIIDDF